MFVLGTSSTNSSVAMGGLSAAGIGGATGAGLAASPNGINGQSGASNNQQNTSSSSAGAGAGAGGAGDPLSQAYTGIQQYAGLSSTLLGQGKGHFFFFFSPVMCCLVSPVRPFRCLVAVQSSVLCYVLHPPPHHNHLDRQID